MSEQQANPYSHRIASVAQYQASLSTSGRAVNEQLCELNVRELGDVVELALEVSGRRTAPAILQMSRDMAEMLMKCLSKVLSKEEVNGAPS